MPDFTMNNSRQTIQNSRRWVVKIGSALLTNGGRSLAVEAIADWVGQIATLREQGIDVVLVSSGAVAAGMSRLGWARRPHELSHLQAAAAVGQMDLVQTYQSEFQQFGLQTAQVLLDHDDLRSRERYLNARSTLNTLLEFGVVPIVNENDTVVTDEIRFGDNDTLGALVANLIEADTLCILTDQEGMYDSNPSTNPKARLITEAKAKDPSLDAKAGGSGALGRGGMITKVRAARLAARSGANTLIVGGKLDRVITRLARGQVLGTLLTADQQPQAARKQWLAGQLQTRGTLVVDEGAERALTEKGRSLLPVGVKSARGRFHRGDLVVCENSEGKEIARGLVNYSLSEALQICGHGTADIEKILGYNDGDELIHRDNLVLSH